MKVLHIIPSWAVGGAEMLVFHLSVSLNSVGIETQVMAWKNCGPLEKKFRAAGVETINLNGKWRFGFFSARRLARLLRESDFDLIHTHLFPLHWWMTFLPLRASLITAYTEHSITNRRRHIPLMREIERQVYQRIDILIAVSDEVKSSLMAWQPTLMRIYAIRNGVPGSLTVSRNQELSNKRLLFVGRLAHVKGVDLLLQACAKLVRQDVEFHLDILGDGPDRSLLERQAVELRLNSHVTFHGLIEDPVDFFNRRPIVVQPSRWEGLPMVTLEAMRSRCPIVAARVGGIPSVLEHGVSALLVAAEDHGQLGHAILSLITDEVMAGNISDRAHEEFLQHYEISRVAAAHIQVYHDTINNVRL